ncbi:carboxypeptidase-like regulatory domain-containing protein [Acinetobacter variabilis]|uniref:Carboxypeptidase regulatory-like domain-containing protein n=1 Tax=Acinetobacter variabilis TaxID=70346 RepID=N9NPX7_9GAMM|nr:carboxypeptidase-like regulatory domain-containing protein [Acinetobacter variabilis]ENX07621.1 hypothetical protein F897_02657 [Acinetobacter variabilis]UBI31581.1 carboxypeptidase-like regulatory domain-containing protein [Acinetobacter variabilis]
MNIVVPYFNTKKRNLNKQSPQLYKISGTVLKSSAPIPCRIRLYEKLTGTKLNEVLSDANGNYEFTNLEKSKYFLVAHDPASQFNAVIQDNVVPK